MNIADGPIAAPLSARDSERGDLCPWKGLSPYESTDAALFVGRGRAVRQLQRLVDAHALAGVIGSSGSGKSSIVLAGLASDSYEVTSFRPGPHPKRRLDAALALTGGGEEERLRSSRRPGVDLLVVDQLEEVFTQCNDEDERRDFLDSLCALTESGSHRVVVALRSDHYGSCAPYVRFARAISSAHLLLGPLGEEELRQIIASPAKLCGLTLEVGLEDEIIDDLIGEPGALPLLSHVLRETWSQRSGGRLSIGAYRAAGGARGAIARTAETVWNALPFPEQRAARSILMRLTTPGAVADRSHQVPVAELVAPGDQHAASALEQLVSARIISLDAGAAEVAHEAVFREWPRLRSWLDDDRASLRAISQLRDTAKEWDESQRDGSVLYRGARLQTVLDLDASEFPLDVLSDEFRAASLNARQESEEELAARNRRQVASNRRLRGLLAVAVVVSMIAASAGVLAVQQRNRAATQRQTADARRLAAASAAVRGDQLDLAALLAIESRRLHRDAETSSSLFSAINEHPGLRAYLQHRRPETAAAIDPTGHYLVDQGAGRATLEVWDLQQSSPSLIRTISLGQTAQATAMLFFHDGKLIVGDDRGSVSVVDPLRGVTLSTSAQHHQGPVRALSFAPDEETIASGGDDGLVRFTLRTTGAATRTPLVVDGQPLEVVAFSSDGGQLAVGSDGGSVFFWDTTNWSVVKRPLEVTRVRSFDWSPDGQRFVVGSDEGMQFYDAATRSVVGDRINAHDGSVLSLQYFNNGREVVSAGADGRVLFWDATTHQPTRAALVGHASAIRVALSDTAKLVATPSDDGRVGIWDLTGRTLSARPLTSRAGFIAALGATSDGMLIGGDQNGTLTTWDREGEMKGFVDVADAAVTALALSDDGKRAVVAASDGSVRIVDPSSGAISSVLPTEKRPPVVGISPDGRWVATATRGPDCIACVRLYDTDRPSLANRELRTLQRTPKTTGHVEAVAFDPTSTILATGDSDGWVDLWSLTSGRHLWGRRLPRGVRAAAFSPRGHQLAVGASSGVLVVINTADGTVSRQLRGHRGDVSGAAFSPNGTLLATTSLGDHELRVWNMATGLTADSLTFGRPAFLGLDDSLAPTWPDDAHVAVPHTKTGAMLYALDDTSLLTQACALARRNLSRAEWMQYLPKRETYRRTCPAFPAEVLESRSS